MKIDSTKTLQGTFFPVLEFKTEMENVLTFKGTSNLNLLLNRERLLNLISKFEFSTYGDKVTVSGGYIHMEYRYRLHHSFEVYPYVESQWAESRGMKHKISSGLQTRYRLLNRKSSLIFATMGLFFEYEKWQHPFPDSNTATYAYSRSIKSHLSLSYNQQLNEKWTLITSVIHQGKPDNTFKDARYGVGVDLKYAVSPSVGLYGIYRLIYDTAPIVPVRKAYNGVETGLSISF
jgi:hypothetical protein